MQNMDWNGFKETKFAVRCEAKKEIFFDECKQNGILVYLSDRAKEKTLFICARRYDDRFSEGRYELFIIEEWHVKPGAMYGRKGLPVRYYDEYI